MAAKPLMNLKEVTEHMGRNSPVYVKRHVINREGFPAPVNKDQVTDGLDWLWSRADINQWMIDQGEKHKRQPFTSSLLGQRRDSRNKHYPTMDTALSQSFIRG